MLPLWAGTAPPLAERAAAPSTLRLPVPALPAVTPVLMTVRAWVRHAFRHRVAGPSHL
ncbi:hypothetical protein GCM10010275_50580 [Streptomyces litmocidini]|uniref:hypothetical protein n=1 Tax=Streptomyces litmocidini TaxID=67318 RepID=UPI00167D1B16|nr:hypothetical protein [Streptomyces litmocidini]GGV04852.1 hypothetical protein GCM10010275_50580 [Streptomyces litmocidini]